ncbi:MAG: gene transfer agent family protein [Pseudomonadota bacterium]
MVNLHRGEISAKLGGAERRMCLTLGALAQLEAELQVGDLQSLAARFSNGRISAKDMAAIIHAGLCGGGHDFTRDEVEALHAEGGLPAYANIVTRLLEATFGTAD